jgi:hypothetical protein
MLAVSERHTGEYSPSHREAGHLDRESAIELLAQHLHWTMERFDPSEDETWEGMTEVQREFFRACVRELLCERELVSVALSYRTSPTTTR